MSRIVTPEDGALAPLTFTSERLRGDLEELVVGTPSLDLQSEQVSQLNLTIRDEGWRMLSAGVLAVGNRVTYADLEFRIAGQETGGGSTEQVTVILRSAHARALREETDPLVMRGVSPTEYLARRCAELGLTFIGEPSAARPQVGRTAPEEGAATDPESDWDVGMRTAKELGYLFGEDGTGSVYFGRPSWLVDQVPRWWARWPEPESGKGELDLTAVPECRRSEDATPPHTATIRAALLPAYAVRPFHAVDMRGVATFSGRTLVRSVKVPLSASAEVTVDVEWPHDPAPEGTPDAAA